MFTLTNLDALAAKYSVETIGKIEGVICEDECGCTGDCGSNWMRS